MKKISIILIVLALALTFVSCNSNDEVGKTAEIKELEKIVVTLDWTPNTNHTGLFVAIENGYFAEQGLEVEIIQPSTGTAEQLVASGSASFGISYQEAVTFARIEEIPIVSIAAIIQHNTSGFMSIAEKGIVTPKDFEGNSYGGWGSPIEEATIKTLVEKDGGDFGKVEILTSGAANFFASSEGDVDFAWVFEGWTGIEAKLKGIEVNYIDLGKTDSALDYYTPVIITSESLINENVEMVEGFMTAVSKGYEFAIKDPEAAGEILLKSNPELDKELVMESQKFLSAKYQDDAEIWGVQKKSVWDNYMNWLLEKELISESIETKDAFTNDFILKK